MDTSWNDKLNGFLDSAGLSEIPMGMFFTDSEPDSSFTPDKSELPTREKELNNQIDWPSLFGNFSCAIGHIWRARKKGAAAYFSAERFGCPGCAFWMGFNKPQVETIVHYVSTGIPGRMEGEHYGDSPDAIRRMFVSVDPEPALGKYCVFKPLTLFEENETPLFVSIFDRPESISGVHQLVTFVTGDPLAVMSPWSASCGSLVAWPMHFKAKGEYKAILGGWDPSARKFFKGDELSLTVPFPVFDSMVARYNESFLVKKTWDTVRKKIAKSRNVWGE